MRCFFCDGEREAVKSSCLCGGGFCSRDPICIDCASVHAGVAADFSLLRRSYAKTGCSEAAARLARDLEEYQTDPAQRSLFARQLGKVPKEKRAFELAVSDFARSLLVSRKGVVVRGQSAKVSGSSSKCADPDVERVIRAIAFGM
jgi:hypothetical protein